MDRTETRRTPVLVGVDGEGHSDDAVEWAAAEAAAAGCPLRIVHAFQPALPVDPYGVVPAAGNPLPEWAAAELALREAAARARAVSPESEVSTRLAPGVAGQVLLTEAMHARMLVLGAHRRSGLRRWLPGAVPGHVTTRAPCPVVVVRTASARNRRRSPPRVVVGVDGTPSCTAAIGFALRAARQRGIPLTVVHAWTPDALADLEAVSGTAAAAEQDGRQAMERSLRHVRDGFGDVAVVTRLVCADPVQALIEESDGAALVVVGSRGRRHAFGSVISTSRSVVRHARCPAAVVRFDAATTDRTPTVDPSGLRHRRPDRSARRQGFWNRRLPD